MYTANEDVEIVRRVICTGLYGKLSEGKLLELLAYCREKGLSQEEVVVKRKLSALRARQTRRQSEANGTAQPVLF